MSAWAAETSRWGTSVLTSKATSLLQTATPPVTFVTRGLENQGSNRDWRGWDASQASDLTSDIAAKTNENALLRMRQMKAGQE